MRIFVGGIYRLTSEDRIKEYFSQYGTVTSMTLMKDEYGESRGFGFIEVEEDACGRAILQKIHVLDRKQLDVRKARPPLDYGDRRNLEKRWGTGKLSVHITRLHPETTTEDVTKVMQKYGDVQSVELKKENDSSYCFASFDHLFDPNHLYEDTIFIKGRRVEVNSVTSKRGEHKKKGIVAAPTLASNVNSGDGPKGG